MSKANKKSNSEIDKIKRKALMYQIISESAGEDVVPVVKYLEKQSDKSEFEISEAIDQAVNKVRSALYRLQTHNLVSYFKQKDKEKGWYVSYWSFNDKEVFPLGTNMNKRKIQMLKQRLKKELKNVHGFFICPSLCRRMEFVEASDYDFKCPDCGKLSVIQDNSRTIEQIRERIQFLEKKVNGKSFSS